MQSEAKKSTKLSVKAIQVKSPNISTQNSAISISIQQIKLAAPKQKNTKVTKIDLV